jgi:hypothetical protein
VIQACPECNGLRIQDHVCLTCLDAGSVPGPEPPPVIPNDREWIWHVVPSIRKTTSWGKRLILVGSRYKYGKTKWTDLDKMTDKQITKIKEFYEISGLSAERSQDGEHGSGREG